MFKWLCSIGIHKLIPDGSYRLEYAHLCVPARKCRICGGRFYVVPSADDSWDAIEQQNKNAISKGYGE